MKRNKNRKFGKGQKWINRHGIENWKGRRKGATKAPQVLRSITLVSKIRHGKAVRYKNQAPFHILVSSRIETQGSRKGASERPQRRRRRRKWRINWWQCFWCAWWWWLQCKWGRSGRRRDSMPAINHASTIVRMNARVMGRVLACVKSNAIMTVPTKKLLVCRRLFAFIIFFLIIGFYFIS